MELGDEVEGVHCNLVDQTPRIKTGIYTDQTPRKWVPIYTYIYT